MTSKERRDAIRKDSAKIAVLAASIETLCWGDDDAPAAPLPCPVKCPCCGGAEGLAMLGRLGRQECMACGCEWYPDRRAPCPECADAERRAATAERDAKSDRDALSAAESDRAALRQDLDLCRAERDAYIASTEAAEALNSALEAQLRAECARSLEFQGRLAKAEARIAELQQDAEHADTHIKSLRQELSHEREWIQEHLPQLDRGKSAEARIAEALETLRAAYPSLRRCPISVAIAQLEGRADG